jgi:DNA mismatch repair ATPase MutS
VENPEERTPMCGALSFVQAYIARLIAKGYKVASARDGGPAFAKGIVSRYVIGS